MSGEKDAEKGAHAKRCVEEVKASAYLGPQHLFHPSGLLPETASLILTSQGRMVQVCRRVQALFRRQDAPVDGHLAGRIALLEACRADCHGLHLEKQGPG